MVGLTEPLEERGWAEGPSIPDRDEFLVLARSIGVPVVSPMGELIKELRPTKNADARPNTLSHRYGTGEFPLHTDTAFWPLPAKYVLLRAVAGGTRRQTCIMSFDCLLQSCQRSILNLIEKSVWKVNSIRTRFYCSMRFRAGARRGWRYDSNCMVPANDAARALADILHDVIKQAPREYINWTPGYTLILSNWTVLHGRGAAPDDEGKRIIERIYVR